MKNSFWLPEQSVPDTHAAFRISFEIPSAANVEIHMVGSAWYRAWLDGAWLLEGPLRYALDRPEYDVHQFDLSAGRHVLAFHVHHVGVDTRILKNTPPFLWCRILVDGIEVTPECRGIRLTGYRPGLRRINPQLGWIENCHTEENPPGWHLPEFEDASWPLLTPEASALPEPERADLAHVRRIEVPMRLIGSGTLATNFGYPDDDPPATFFLRELDPPELPPTGLWRRYDLGRVRLGSPEFIVEAPAGTVLEIAHGEYLSGGRVSPWINFSLGQSCNLDRYVLAGGRQVIAPLTPKGGRFIEVHIVNSLEAIMVEERFHERTYHAPTEAEFECGDPLLERIWRTGIETYRACAEDAIIDNPTRERGQWIGDVATVGMAVATVAYGDLRLFKRALEQAALCPREDGLVAGLCPGGCAYLPTYAFQWTVAVMNYYLHTGDRALLVNLYPAAQKNLQAIEAFLEDDGLHSVAGWNFIDWGYKVEEPVDLACNLHYLWSLRSMVQWAETIALDGGRYASLADRVEGLISRRMEAGLKKDFDGLGYHCTVLALALELVPEKARAAALDFLKAHLLACFPNDPNAPRNDNPFGFERRLITPYFAHYAFPLLIEAGEMDFVLDQYRRCWGWMLEGDRTTWVEVFDPRWSHCHQWSGCPTWQLSRYLSGLHPRHAIAPGTFDWKFHPGSLRRARIKFPHPTSGTMILIEWERQDRGILYRLETPSPITVFGIPGSETSRHLVGTFECYVHP
jgi:alpha-L-rhamnosidase